MKIVTIGGGSSYTPELIEGLILRQNKLPIKELWLVDIEEGLEKLEVVGEMAKRMIKAAGLDWQVHLTLNRREALVDADFVTTQFRVGLLDARIRDERIPLSYGMIGQETNGAGGIFKALRTIPVILELIKDMEVLCPNAWLIDFTNPAGMVTEAAIKVGGWKRTIGLCNVPVTFIKLANEVLGYGKEEKAFMKFAGINHLHWHRVWDKEGVEKTDELIHAYFHPDSKLEYQGMTNVKNFPIAYDFVKDLGMIPISYHNYYYLTEKMLDDQLEAFKTNTTRAETVKRTEAELLELYKDPNLDYKPEQLTKRGGAYYSDAACDIISSIHNDERKLMVVSTQNNGAIADLPYDSIVEITSMITSHGAEPLNWGKFPPQVRGTLQVMKAMEECTIKAASEGDYGSLLSAFTINPIITSGETAIEMMHEMLVANKDYLPQFKEKIKELEEQGVTYTPR